jgi:hypothetical protein
MAELFSTLLQTHGVEGLVRRATRAVQHGRELEVALCFAGLMTLPTLADQRLAREAGAGRAVLGSLAAFPRSRAVAPVALAALVRVWAFGLDDTVEALVDATLACLAAHKDQLVVAQTGLRLLRHHVQSAQQVVAAPRVLATVERVARAFPTDETLQHWVGEIVVALNAIEPHELVAAHGALGHEAVREATVRLCHSTPRPASLRVGGVDWQAKVLELYPRLRERD